MDHPSDISQKDISVVISTLTANIAKPITNQIDGSNKMGTAPVARGYIAVTHPDLLPDLEGMPDFKRTESYGSQFQPLLAEWGAYSSIRFLQTTQCLKQAGTSALGNTIYNNLVLGKDAFAIIRQDMNTAKIVGPKKVGALEDKYQYGIKTVFAGAMLMDQHVANLMCTRSTELL